MRYTQRSINIYHIDVCTIKTRAELRYSRYQTTCFANLFFSIRLFECNYSLTILHNYFSAIRYIQSNDISNNFDLIYIFILAQQRIICWPCYVIILLKFKHVNQTHNDFNSITRMVLKINYGLRKYFNDSNNPCVINRHKFEISQFNKSPPCRQYVYRCAQVPHHKEIIQWSEIKLTNAVQIVRLAFILDRKFSNPTNLRDNNFLIFPSPPDTRLF